MLHDVSFSKYLNTRECYPQSHIYTPSPPFWEVFILNTFNRMNVDLAQICEFKGTVSRDFLLQVFSWITFPQAPENNIRVISNFFENSRRYSQVKVHHRWQIAAGINDTDGKYATGINNTGGKFCHQFRLCCWHRWQICHRCQRYRQQICRRCQRRRWQIATSINDTGGKFATGVNDTGGK